MPAPRRKPADLSYFRDDGAHFIRKVPFVPIYRTSQWIEDNCRKAWDQPTEYKPELYEYWFTGRKEQAERLNMRVQKQGGKFVWQESVCDELLRNFEIVAERQKKNRQENEEQKELVQKEFVVPRAEFHEVKFASIALSEIGSLNLEEQSSSEFKDFNPKKVFGSEDESLATKSDQPQ